MENRGEIQRRSFLGKIARATIAVLGLVIAAPLSMAAFLDPLRRRTLKSADGPKELASLADLPAGKPVKLDVVSRRIDAWDRADARVIGAAWLRRRPDGRVTALSAVCPHLGCSIGFDEQKGVFACPCHASAFALEDGARIFGPSPRGMDPLPCEVSGGKVFVTFKRFLQGIPTRREG